ncbi:DUF2778 domain-containing protein, partial [Methylobacterium segetis]|uniref:DUF2778 domain-containing protein n=1 Tax=Methylobacterium segetis TaxID=2488750 RepID=UPI0010457407
PRPQPPTLAAAPVLPAAEPAAEPAVDTAEAPAPDPVEPLDGQAPILWREAILGSLRAGSPDHFVAEYDPLPTPSTLIAIIPEDGPMLAQTVPLPVPRPPEFRRPGTTDLARRAERLAARRAGAPAPAAVAEDDRNFFEKLFNVERAPASALSYASLSPNPAESLARRSAPPAPTPSGGSGIAVYDISARVVVLPNGEKLEAHSGLGESMDDPASVNIKMRGATPPGTYDLTEREQLFHGVRAIRLNPVGGSAAVYGRAGLLAHTYMLGPSGASNGCVSFRDYDKFLQAYLRGEIQRLVVVAGARQDRLPSLARQGGRPERLARVGDDS